MASDAPGSPPDLGGRLRRVGEMLIGLSGSPVPTHLFQTLAEQAQAVVPHDYRAVRLEDVEQRGYPVHSLTGLPGEATAGRLQQVLMNLIGNAIKYTRDGGRVRVTVEAPDAIESPVRIRVIDNGIGIPGRDRTHRRGERRGRGQHVLGGAAGPR